jgi:hypothetical protein
VKDQYWESRIQDDGQLKVPGYVDERFLPQAMRDYLRPVHEMMKDACERVLSVIRWRYDLAGRPLNFTHHNYDWSLDGQTWYPTLRGDRLSKTCPARPW